MSYRYFPENYEDFEDQKKPKLAILLGYSIESEIERIGKSEILRDAGDVSVYPIQAGSPYSPFFAFDLYFVLNFEN